MNDSSFDIERLIKENSNKALDLQEEFINPSFTKVLKTIGFDIHFKRGTGPYLFDEKNQKYLDCLSGYGVFGIGRNHPVLKKTLNKVMEMDLPNLIKMGVGTLPGLLAAELVKKANNRCKKVFFANSGTEVVEAALKFSRAATGRDAFLHLEGSYHGLTLGSLSVTGCGSFRNGFGTLPESKGVFMGDLDELEKELKKKKYACFIFEPIQGKGVFYPRNSTGGDTDYYNQAQSLCKKYGTLFVADEIQSGMGRSGKFFAYEHWGLEPDIILLSKALSGGMVPISAILVPDDVHKKTFSSMDRCVVHSTTFSQNDLACAAGLATLHVLDEEKLIEKNALHGEMLIKGIQNLIPKYEMLKEVRGKGVMIAFEFGAPKSLKLNIGWKLVHAADAGLFAQMIIIPLLTKHKILTQVAGHNMDVIKLLPSYAISSNDIQWLLSALDDVLEMAHQFPGSMWNVGTKLTKAAVSQTLSR